MKLTGARVPALWLIGALLLATVGVGAAVARSQAPDDAYLWFADSDVTAHDNVKILPGDEVPSSLYEGRWHSNPVVIAEWGLQQEARGHVGALLTAADWLVEHQRPDGGWGYDFEWYVYSADLTLEPGWISGMAQGLALSVLTRAHEASGDARYLQAGDRALRPLTVDVAEGGVAQTWRGHLWFEEYPTSKPSLVLNGMIFTLIGLREWADGTGDATARRLYDAGESSVAALAPLADLGDGQSAYALAFRDRNIPPSPVAGTPYAKIHVQLTAEMYELTGRPVYERLSERWSALVPPTGWSLALRVGVCVLAALAIGGAIARRRLSVGGVEPVEQQADDAVVLSGQRPDLRERLGVRR